MDPYEFKGVNFHIADWKLLLNNVILSLEDHLEFWGVDPKDPTSRPQRDISIDINITKIIKKLTTLKTLLKYLEIVEREYGPENSRTMGDRKQEEISSDDSKHSGGY